MAKFTKLNIGDSVASSGGRVWKKLSAESAEVQDELAGTWVFNEQITMPYTISGTSAKKLGYYSFSNSFGLGATGYVSNGAWSCIVFQRASTSKINFSLSDLYSVSSIYYNIKSNKWYYYDGSSPAYITIPKGTVVSNVDLVSGYELPDFKTWLKANATKVS